MSSVSATFAARWRSGRHFGPARPSHQVFIRHGEYRRGYHTWDGPTVNADIYGESRQNPWYPVWTPTTDWVEIPGVQNINLDQSFEQDGTTVATLTVDNILMQPTEGVMGYLYHLIVRGALSPMRGYKAPGLPYNVPPTNDWSGVIVEDAQIKVLQGYGDALEPTFVGFIDKVTPKAKPDQLSITARCTGGKVLSDEHIFGWNKSKQLPEPVIFQQSAIRGKIAGYNAEASSVRAGHPARFVTDKSAQSAWISDDHSTDANTEWVEVRLKRGSYSRFVILNGYAGMEMYVGIYARSALGSNTTTGGSTIIPPKHDGVDIPEGWVDLGLGTVPGAHGGWDYVRKYNAVSDKLNSHNLPGTFEVGDNSILRIGFRNLFKIEAGVYRASVARLNAMLDPTPPTNKRGKPSKVVTVQDPADIVRCVLRWAGFTDWKVDDTGVVLEGPFVFTRASTYMDIIKKVQDAVGFTFYMEDPTDDDLSLGAPVFRQTNVLADDPSAKTIRDKDLLTEMEVNLTDDPKSYIIRVRGRDDKQGLQLGAQTNRALMAVYRPPWSSGRRMSKIIRRHYTHTDPHLKKQIECEYLARLIALEMALQGATATAVVPGTPEFELDSQVGLVDTGTGTATRLYIVRRSSEYIAGQQARYMTTIGGSLIDSRDVYEVKRDIDKLFSDNGLPGRLTQDA